MDKDKKVRMIKKYFGKGTPEWIVDKCVMMLNEHAEDIASSIPFKADTDKKWTYGEIYHYARSISKKMYFLEELTGIKSYDD
jgi:hypothetical protein